MTVDARLLIATFAALAERFATERGHLCALDGEIGDGDHGIAMAQGSAAASAAVKSLDSGTATCGDVFNAAARAFLGAVGASCGPLYATAFMRAGAAVKGKASMDDADVVAVFAAMAEGIRARGKAEPGEKTMVDAWQPAADALAGQAASGDLAAALSAAADAARQGAEATSDMVAGKGRSARLGERARGHVDPGAASAAIMIEVMAKSLGSY